VSIESFSGPKEQRSSPNSDTAADQSFSTEMKTIPVDSGRSTGTGSIKVTSIENDPDVVYQPYIEAIEQLSTMMADGRGDTAEANRMYKEYQLLKQSFEELEGE